jgi:hypothetical protein
MDTRQSFRVGAKLIALYYLIMALPTLLGVVLQILPMVQGGGETFDPLLGSSFVAMLLFPVIIGVVGFYVLRNGALFQRWTESGADFVNTEKTVEWFAVGVKLLGVYFVLSSIPTLSQRLVNFLILVSSRDSSVAMMAAEGLGMRSNFLPQIIVMMFGLLLLARGDLLTRWAFPSHERLDNIEC